MSTDSSLLKSLKVASFGILIITSVTLDASESEFNKELTLHNSQIVPEKQLSELEAKVKVLEKNLDAIHSDKSLQNQDNIIDTRLKSIESSLDSMTDKDKYFTYADWAAVAITCVAVLLTIIGLAIAALAFWGYREIIELTKNSAAEEAQRVTKNTIEEIINGVAKNELEKLINDGKLRQPLQDAVDLILRTDSNDIEKTRTKQLLEELDVLESEFDMPEENDCLNSDKNRRSEI